MIKHESKEFNGTLYDLEKALKDIHKEMTVINEKRGIDKDSREYVTNAEQIAVKVYKQHFYTPDEKKYQEHKNNLNKIEQEIKEIMISLIEPIKFDSSEEEEKYNYIELKKVNNALAYFKTQLSELDSEKDYNTIYDRPRDLKAMITSSLSHIKKLTGKEKQIQLIMEKTKEYFTHYDYIYNQSGYIAGIYRNNGDKYEATVVEYEGTSEETRRKYILDRNLITMGFLRAKNFNNNYQTQKSIAFGIISSVVGVMFDENLLKELGSIQIDEVQSIVKKLQNINEKFGKLPGLTAGLSSAQGYSEIMKFLSNNDSIVEKHLKETKHLCKELSLKEGLSQETKNTLDNLSIVCAFLGLPYGIGIAASLIFGPGAEIFGNQKSEDIGNIEINRFINNINAGSIIDTDALNSQPPEINYKNETELESIVANGTTKNEVKTGVKNNYIRAINGTNNILDGGGGDDIIIGWKKVDTIIGGLGDDRIEGGEGDDILIEGEGEDTYIYYKGDGHDIIRGLKGSPVEAGSRSPEKKYENKLKFNGFRKRDISEISTDKDGKIKITFKNDNGSITLEDAKKYTINSRGALSNYVGYSEFNNNFYLEFEDGKVNLSNWLLMRKGRITTNELDNFVILTNPLGQVVNVTEGDNKITGGYGSDEYIFTENTRGNTVISDTKFKNSKNRITMIVDDFAVMDPKEKKYVMNKNIEISTKHGNTTIRYKDLWSVTIDEKTSSSMELQVVNSDNLVEGIIDLTNWTTMGEGIVELIKNKNNNKNIPLKDYIIMVSENDDNYIVDDIYVDDWSSDEIEAYWEKIQKMNPHSQDYINGSLIENMTRAKIWDSIKRAKEIADRAVGLVERRDPMIIDLNNDGFNISNKDEGVYFDLDNDGIKEKTSWVSKEDGLMVVDFNNDGKINNATELFGDRTILENDRIARNGIEALTYFDKNKDLIIDENDEIFSKLKVWQDINQNGITEDGELKTLDELEIKSINLKNIERKNITIEDSVLSRSIEYTKKNEEKGKIGEFLLSRNNYDTFDEDIKNLPKEILELPNVYSFGKARNLHNEMYLDKTGHITQLVKSFTQTHDIKNRYEILDELLIKISKSEKIYKNSRGSYGNAKHFNVVEYFLGREPSQEVLNDFRAKNYNEAYRLIRDAYYEAIIYQTTIKKYTKHIMRVKDNRLVDIDLLSKSIELKLSENKEEGKILLRDMSKILKTMEINQGIKGFDEFLNYFKKLSIEYEIAIHSNPNESIHGDEKDNTIESFDDNNSYLLYGKGGNDTLKGNNNVLIGGQGNDVLEGGEKETTYVFELGDGNDVIKEKHSPSSIKDRIVFASDITRDDIDISRVNNDITKIDNDMLIKVYSKDKTRIDNQITIQSGFNWLYSIEEIHFSDGEILDFNTIVEEEKQVIGTDNEDILTGFEWDDTFRGNYGSDTYLIGMYEGYDTIIDTPSKNKDIENTIKLKEGITQENVLLKRKGDDLIIQFTNNINSSYDEKLPNEELINSNITVKDYYLTDKPTIKDIVFEDGTIWDSQIINEKARYIYGTTQDDEIVGNVWSDIIYSSHGNDTIEAAKGDDIIQAMAGSDTYVFSRGDGVDIIQGEIDYHGNPSTDTISFKEGIDEEDVRIRQDKKDLVIEVYSKDKEQIDNKIIVKDDFHYITKAIEQIKFANGTIWDKETVYSKAKYVYGTKQNDNIKLEHGQFTVDAGRGDDIINASAGSTTYLFARGDGVDIIQGEIDYHGNPSTDTISFKEGIDEEDVRIRQDKKDLVIEVYSKDKEQIDNKIIVKDDFHYITKAIEQIKFANGTIWDKETVYSKAKYVYGTKQNDNIKLEHGQFTVDAGRGDDIINASAGSTTYLFARGDGVDIIQGEIDYKGNPSTDTISFKEGVDEDDIRIKRQGKDMLIQVLSKDKNKIDNEIIVKDEYKYITPAIEQIKFANGALWNRQKIDEVSSYIYGTPNNDTINASNKNDIVYAYEGNDIIKTSHGDDIINAGKDNDIIEGYTGSDTYIFNKGDGQDIIREIDYQNNPSTDKAIIGSDILNIMFENQGRNVKMTLADTQDSITIENWNSSKVYQIEEFHSSDNKVLYSNQVSLLIQAMASYTKDKGIDWNTAIKQNPNEIQNILQNFWVAKTN